MGKDLRTTLEKGGSSLFMLVSCMEQNYFVKSFEGIEFNNKLKENEYYIPNI